MAGEVRKLELRGDEMTGEAVLEVRPGTRREERDRALDALLATPLADLAREQGVVVGAAPHAYAFELGGRDPEGRTRFEVLGRVEGEVLVPRRASKKRRT